MPPMSAEDQLNFVVECLRYTQDGKINFDAVAGACEIVSKGAAAKRYERFLKQHQLHQSQNPGNNANAPKAPNNTKAKNAKGNGSLVAPSAGLGKKRKMTAASDGDDELELKPAKKIAKSNNNNQEDGSDANTGNKLISKTEVDAEKVKKEIMDEDFDMVA